MASIADKIMGSVKADGRGTRLYRASDFMRLSSTPAIWQALTRLTKAGILRRVARGIYDFPRHSNVLNTAVPPNIDAVAKTLGAVAKDDLAAANALGLTTAVPVRPSYLTAGPTRTRVVGNMVVEMRHAPAWLLALRDTPAMAIVQALRFLGPDGARDAVPKLKSRVTPSIACALASARVVGWLDRPVRQLAAAA